MAVHLKAPPATVRATGRIDAHMGWWRVSKPTGPDASARATRRQLLAAVFCAATIALSAGPASATFRGHDGRIVLQMETARHGVQLVTADPVTGAWRRLTGVPGYLIYPDWSPDGRLIAFEVDSPSGDRCRIELVRAGGGRIRNLSHGQRDCEQVRPTAGCRRAGGGLLLIAGALVRERGAQEIRWRAEWATPIRSCAARSPVDVLDFKFA